MKKIILLVLSLTSTSAFSYVISPNYLVCSKNEECAVVTTKCACLHNSTCAQEDDQRNGIVAPIAKQFTSIVAHLSACSDAEKKSCAAAGACPMRGEWISKCEKGRCVLNFKAKKL